MSIDNNVLKGLMTVVVESSLLFVDSNGLEKTTKHLKEKYNCYLPDCLEKPEYLKNTLKELYDGAYDEITNQIKQKLADFTNRQEINKFVEELDRP